MREHAHGMRNGSTSCGIARPWNPNPTSCCGVNSVMPQRLAASSMQPAASCYCSPHTCPAPALRRTTWCRPRSSPRCAATRAGTGGDRCGHGSSASCRTRSRCSIGVARAAAKSGSSAPTMRQPKAKTRSTSPLRRRCSTRCCTRSTRCRCRIARCCACGWCTACGRSRSRVRSTCTRVVPGLRSRGSCNPMPWSGRTTRRTSCSCHRA